MADSANRSQRAAALEEKRRKLEELKKKRALRSGGDATAARKAASSNLDEYIDGLLQQSSQPPPAEALQKQASTASQESGERGTEEINKGSSDNLQGGEGGATAQAEEPKKPSAEASAPAPPPRVETFTVSTQTETFEDEEPPAPEEEISTAVVEPDDDNDKKDEDSEPAVREPSILTPDQVATEVNRNDFGTFLTTASKKVERLLGNAEWTQSLLVDAVVDNAAADGSESAETGADRQAAGLVTGRQVYEAGKWTASRDVTDVSWSTHSRDVFLAAYHAPSVPYGSGSAVSSNPVKTHTATATSASSFLTPRSGELQADGLVLIWSCSMPQRPEHVLTCASPVMAVRQSQQQPAMVLGGCASGQVVVWDVRAGGRYPVQTSAFTALASTSKAVQGHVHPICGMEFTDGGAGLVTSSSDGRLNFWSMSNLREPVESIQVPGGSVACLAVAPESESLVMGDEQGSFFTLTASATSGNTKKASGSLRRKQVRKLEATAADNEEISSNGHFGMVTSIATRSRIQRSTGLVKGFCRGSGGLVLTTGVDWTTKLWAPAYKDSPLLSWTSHSYDPVSDVQWNPQNPGIFATASSSGTIGLWNLAQSLDDSLTDGLTLSTTTTNDGEEVEGLTKLAWSIPDGRRLAVAGSGGRVHVLTLADEVVRPKGDEDAKIVQQLVARGFLSRP